MCAALRPSCGTHPGKKTIFNRGMEFGQRGRMECLGDLNGICLQFDPHQGLLNLVDEPQQFLPGEPGPLARRLCSVRLPGIDLQRQPRHSVSASCAAVERRRQWLDGVANSCLRRTTITARVFPLEGFYAEVSTRRQPIARSTSAKSRCKFSDGRRPCTATAIRFDSVCRRLSVLGVPQGCGRRSEVLCDWKAAEAVYCVG